LLGSVAEEDDGGGDGRDAAEGDQGAVEVVAEEGFLEGVGSHGEPVLGHGGVMVA
jgi:hypothetical protein